MLRGLFLFWLLSFPLYLFDVLGSLSMDNLLTPLLLFLSPLCLFGDRSESRSHLATILVVTGLLFASQTVRFMGDSEIFKQRSWELFKLYSYFLLPILYVRDYSFLKKVNLAMVVITLAGALSAFLVAAGALNLHITRFEDSRLGIAGIPKSIGFFTNYGDIAILFSYTLMLVLFTPRAVWPSLFSSKMARFAILACLLLGLVGNQSRNVVLSLVLAAGANTVELRKSETP